MTSPRAAFLATFLLSLPLAAQETRLLPADPQAGEAFAVVSGFSFRGQCGFVTSLMRAENSDIVVEQPRNPFGNRLAWCRMGAPITGLAAGAYTVRAPALLNENASFGQTSPITLPITVSPAGGHVPQYRDLDGNWFDPAQPGWGMNVVQGESGALFGVLLTYSENGGAGVSGAEWLVMPAGRWITPTRFRGLLMASARPRFGQEPVATAVSVMGLATLDLLAPDRMKLTIVRVSNHGSWRQDEWALSRFAF